MVVPEITSWDNNFLVDIIFLLIGPLWSTHKAYLSTCRKVTFIIRVLWDSFECMYFLFRDIELYILDLFINTRALI